MKEFFEILTKVKKQFRKKNKNIPLFKIPGMGKYRVSDRDIMEKRGWMVYPRSSAGKGNAFGWLKEEAARCGIELDVLIDDELSAVAGERLKVLRCGEEMERPDFVVMRHYDTTLAVHFERMGIRVINTPQAMDISRNKMLTHQLFVRNGIPTPETLYTSLSATGYDALSLYFADSCFVVKAVSGSKGEQVFLVRNEADLREAVKTCGDFFLAQRFVAGSEGRDIRAWIVGNRVVGAVMRYNDHSFKSNFSLGGKAKEVEVTPEIAQLSLRCAKIIGLEFAGIDLLFGETGYSVCEINGNAGFRTISSVSGEVNIPRALFEYIAGLRK